MHMWRKSESSVHEMLFLMTRKIPETPEPVPQPVVSSKKKSNKEPEDTVIPEVEDRSLAPSSSGRRRRLPKRFEDFVLSEWEIGLV